MNADNTPISVPRLTPPDGTITNQSPDEEARLIVDSLDADEIRQMLNWETTINNKLRDVAKGRLASALDCGRYIIYIGMISPDDGMFHWSLEQPEYASNRFFDVDIENSVFHLAELILQGRQKSQTREASNAVSDLGE